jgi:hypothetical protein
MQLKELLLWLKKEEPFIITGTPENVLPFPVEGSQ